jgi:hypothetical protein
LGMSNRILLQQRHSEHVRSADDALRSASRRHPPILAEEEVLRGDTNV